MVKKSRSQPKPTFLTAPVAANFVGKKAQMLSVTRLARRILQFVAGALALTFTWLKFHGINFAPLVNDLSAQLVLRTTLATYYVSWVAGLSFDADEQEVLYVEPPDRSRVIVTCIITALIVAIPFGVLCYFQSYRAFAGTLSAFLIGNIIAWLIVIHWLLPAAVTKTAEYYKNQGAHAQLLGLKLFVDDYLHGSWQVWRFSAGAALVAMIDIVAFTGLYEHLGIPHVLMSKEFAVATLLFIFVLVMEGWCWARKLQCRVERLLLERLEASYEFRPRTPDAL
jgi:hypothetical protein